MSKSLTTHDFARAQFNKPTYCQYCEKFIWGFVKQGYSCTQCGYHCHKACLTKSKTVPCRGEKTKENPLDAYLTTLLSSPSGSNIAVAEPQEVQEKLETYIDATDQGIQAQSELEQAKNEEKELMQRYEVLSTEHERLKFILEQLNQNGFT